MANNERVAVVTGSAQGLGKGIAEKLGENGFKVVLSDINEEVLNETLEELKGKGYDVIAKVADVSKRSDHEALIEATVDAFGHIDASWSDLLDTSATFAMTKD